MEKQVDERVMETGGEPIEAEKKVTSVHPPMTFKRFMVLFSLIWLIVTSATPILFITAALCTSLTLMGTDSSVHDCRYWRRKIGFLAWHGKHPRHSSNSTLRRVPFRPPR